MICKPKAKNPELDLRKAGRQAAMKKDDADQSKRFIAKAREIEADEKSEPRKSVAKK